MRVEHSFGLKGEDRAQAIDDSKGVLAHVHYAGANAEPEIAGEESGPLRIPDDLVIGTMAGREHELQRRVLQTLPRGCERALGAPHQKAVDAGRGPRAPTAPSRPAHGQREAAGTGPVRA